MSAEIPMKDSPQKTKVLNTQEGEMKEDHMQERSMK